MSTRIPVEIRRLKKLLPEKEVGSGLLIRLSDDSEHILNSEILRRFCPCAECQERRGDTSHAKPLSGGGRAMLRVVKSTIDSETDLTAIFAVGQYAIGLRWDDGHDSGIFSFDYLDTLISRKDDLLNASCLS